MVTHKSFHRKILHHASYIKEVTINSWTFYQSSFVNFHPNILLVHNLKISTYLSSHKKEAYRTNRVVQYYIPNIYLIKLTRMKINLILLVAIQHNLAKLGIIFPVNGKPVNLKWNQLEEFWDQLKWLKVIVFTQNGLKYCFYIIPWSNFADINRILHDRENIIPYFALLRAWYMCC